MWLIKTLLLCTVSYSLAKSPPDYCSVCGTTAARPSSPAHRAPRVFDGSISNYAPWSVYIEYEGRIKGAYCTATIIIIDLKHILTAAHCFLEFYPLSPKKRAKFVQIYAGDLRKKGAKHVQLNANAVHLHPKFVYMDGDVNSREDIALIVLKKPIKVTDNLRPVCLGGEANAGDRVLIQGYGRYDPRVSGHDNDTSTEAYEDYLIDSGSLREGMLKVQTDEECKRIYKQLLKHEHFCAKNDTNHVSACPGDSGGGLLKKIEGRQYVVGISSWGGHCDGFPGEGTGPYLFFI